MNAVLAKPIRANWFIDVPTFDLPQLDAAALFGSLPSWLRDHPPLPGIAGKCCVAPSENFQREFIAPRRLRSAAYPVGLGKVDSRFLPTATRRPAVSGNCGRLTDDAKCSPIDDSKSCSFAVSLRIDRNRLRVRSKPQTRKRASARCQPLARASPASRTSILRKPTALVTRSGKSSRSVTLSACMSMPSGSQPVQRQSAGSAPSSRVA